MLSFRFAFFIETMDCLLQKGQWSAVAIISYQCKYLEYFNLNPETKVGSRLFDNFFRRWTKTLRLKTLNDIIHPWMNKRQTQTCCKMKRNKKEIRDWLSTCNWDCSRYDDHPPPSCVQMTPTNLDIHWPNHVDKYSVYSFDI